VELGKQLCVVGAQGSHSIVELLACPSSRMQCEPRKNKPEVAEVPQK